MQQVMPSWMPAGTKPTTTMTTTGKVTVVEWLKNSFPLVPWPKSSATFVDTVASQRICLYASTYYQNLYSINNQEIPNLPPFGEHQNFHEDKFIDIILYGTPGSWA
jgi:hypothetical protein